MAGDQPEISGSAELAAADREPREAPAIRVGDRGVGDGGEARALPSGELRFPQKYGVTERELPRDVGGHAVTARRYGEAADELSERVTAGLLAVEGLREQRQQATAREAFDLAARLGAEIEGHERRHSDMQLEMLKLRYAEIDERSTAIANAKVQAAIWDRDRPASDQVDPSLVVAQTLRDLADGERRMDDVLDVLGERTKFHLEESINWASRAERESGGDEPRRNRAVGFQGEVYQRLGDLKVGLAADNPGWITGHNGAISNYETAAHLFHSIGDHEAAQRVEQRVDRLMPGRGQDDQGS